MINLFIFTSFPENGITSTFVYGYCLPWILMGSIAGGVVSLCGCSHIICSLKRAKTARTIIHLKPDDIYDEVETLNYNNALFDYIVNDEELHDNE